MGEEPATLDLNGPDGTGDPSGRAQTGAEDPNAKKPRWKLTVRGQEMLVDDEKKAIELMQKGASYEESNAALKEERRQLREEHAKNLKAFEGWFDLDKRAREDPALQRRLQAAIQNQPFPEDQLETDDPYMKEINALKRQNAELMRAINDRVGGVSTHLDELRRDRQYREGERMLRGKYKKWATDENIDAAREHAERHGLDLVTAFKAVTYDQIPERARQDVFEEFNLDPELLTPARGEVPTIDGLGPVTPENLARVYADTDEYARFKPALREHRRRLTGKIEMPR